MIVKTIQSQRSVLLTLNLTESSDTRTGVEAIESVRVIKISALFSDLKDVLVERFVGNDEAALLRRFWRSLRPTDRIFAKNAVENFEILRRRSWHLDVIPAMEIDLRSVYNVQLWDTSSMWIEGYVPGPLFVTKPTIEPETLFLPEAVEVTVHCRD